MDNLTDSRAEAIAQEDMLTDHELWVVLRGCKSPAAMRRILDQNTPATALLADAAEVLTNAMRDMCSWHALPPAAHYQSIETIKALLSLIASSGGRVMKGDLHCIEGRLLRHDPQWDDPELETDMGECPDCSGKGCEQDSGGGEPVDDPRDATIRELREALEEIVLAKGEFHRDPLTHAINSIENMRELARQALGGGWRIPALSPCKCGDDQPQLGRACLDSGLGYFVYCGGACVLSTQIFETREQAVAAWNEGKVS